MRWNCPHCSSTVALGIDIEQIKRAYVRCGSCNGVALIQHKVAYADHTAASADREASSTTSPQTTRPKMEMTMQSDAQGNMVSTVSAAPSPVTVATPPPFRREASRTPSFFTRHDLSIPMPMLFATETRTPHIVENAREKMLRRAVGLAMVIAVISGFYIFSQGKKLLQTSSTTHTTSNTRQ